MSERLLFELKAVDNATAPLRQVQNELQRTAGVAGSATKDFRKFALGGLQQAGFQVGDFAVQLANGTNQMQAFGQQAPQLLQIFGPIGSLVGAGVAVFAAFSVVMEKSAVSSKDLTNAMSELKNMSKDLSAQMDMLNFNVETEAEATALKNILALRIEIAQKQMALTSEVAKSRADASKSELITEMSALKAQIAAQQAILDEINKKRDALAQAKIVEEGLLAVQMAYYTNIGNAERERIATGNDIYKQMIAIQNANAEYIKSQEISVGLLIQQYSLYGQIATSAAAIAAATQNTQYFKLGTLNEGMMGRAGSKGQGEAVNYSFVEPKKTGGGGASKNDPLKTLREQLALETELLGKTEAQQRVIQALGVDWQKYGTETVNGLTEQINRMAELNRIAEMQKQIGDSIKSSMEDAFMGIVDGTSSAKDAFRSMAAEVIKELYRVLVVQQMVGQLGSATSAGTGLLGGIGRLFGMRAMGGPVTSGQPYMVGERGPEIIVPSRNGSVVPNNQLGGGGVTVNQTINITTGVQQTVRAEIRSLMPQIADSAKAAVLDARRRGGSYGSAFA
jgi:hypothetical protein